MTNLQFFWTLKLPFSKPNKKVPSHRDYGTFVRAKKRQRRFLKVNLSLVRSPFLQTHLLKREKQKHKVD